MDGDDSIHALADKIEANLSGGFWATTATVNIPATANTAAAVVVTFPAGRFSTPPRVFVNGQVTGAVYQFSFMASTATTTSVTVTGARNTSGAAAIPVSVLAHEAP
jgi:hypothetical protein